MAHKHLPTQLVGSYAQPAWLIDKVRLGERLPPRVRAKELWRVSEEFRSEACQDATIAALRDQELAGVDIVTDGEICRESYSNRFSNALAGIDVHNPGEAMDRTGKLVPVPRVFDEIRRVSAVEVEMVKLLKRHTRKAVKMTLPGPFTMAQQAQNDFYASQAELAMAYAEALNDEVMALFAAGADMVQLDEPYVQARPEAAREHAVAAIDRALQGSSGATVLHVCFGYGKHVADKPSGYSFLAELDDCAADEISIEVAQPGLSNAVLELLPSKRIHVGVLDLRDGEAETAGCVAARLRKALDVLPPERLVVAPDCGMKYLSRDLAFAKLEAMVAGADIVRNELGLD